jgi:hypothetical protein
MPPRDKPPSRPVHWTNIHQETQQGEAANQPAHRATQRDGATDQPARRATQQGKAANQQSTEQLSKMTSDSQGGASLVLSSHVNTTGHH